MLMENNIDIIGGYIMRKTWNYILASIFFILAMIKIYMPNLVLVIRDRIDKISLLLIIIGVVLVFYKYFISKRFRK